MSSAVLYVMTSIISVSNSLRRIWSSSMNFPETGKNVALSTVIVDNTSSGFMVDVRFRVEWRSSANGRLMSNCKLCTYIEEHHCGGKVYVLNF